MVAATMASQSPKGPSQPNSDFLLRVSSDQNGFKEGQELTDLQQIIKYLCLAFNAGRDENEQWKHGEGVLIGIVARNPQRENEASTDYEDRLIEAMEDWGKTPEERELPPQSAQDDVNNEAAGLEQLAKEAATILGADNQLGVILSQIDEAEKTRYMGPVRIYQRLKQMVTIGTINPYSLLPEPGTHKDDIKEGSNRPYRAYDYYYKYVIGANGEKRRKEFSLIDEMSRQLPMLLSARQRIDRINDLSDTEMNDIDKRSEKAPESATIKTLSFHLRRAIGLWYRFDQMERLRNINCNLVPDTKGKDAIKVTPKPITIFNPKNPIKEGNVFSVAEFLSMKPAILPSDAGYEDLLKTMRKEEQAKKYPTPATLVDMQAATRMYEAAFSNVEIYKMVMDDVTKDPGSEFATRLNNLSMRLDTIMNTRSASENARKAS